MSLFPDQNVRLETAMQLSGKRISLLNLPDIGEQKRRKSKWRCRSLKTEKGTAVSRAVG